MQAKSLVPVVAALLLAATGGPAGASSDHADRAGGPARPDSPSGRADFNGDGYADLAIGSPSESVGAVTAAGTIHVLYRTGSGISGVGSQLFNQESAGVGSDAEANDFFGDALATGDYDGDGYADLAIGSRGEDVGTLADAGVVQVLYGTASGLTATGSQTITQDTWGVVDDAEEGDGFGQSLASGDTDGDGVDDLVIGSPYETVDGQRQAGMAHVLYGTPGGGLTGVGSTALSQSDTAVPSNPEADDLFGVALTTGDLDGDARDEVVVGAGGESVGTVANAGTATVLRGTASGTTTSGAALFTQDTTGVPGTAEPGDFFGLALATGDFTGDGIDDLAVGAPNEAVGTLDAAGAVTVLQGSPTGLTATGSQQLTQDSGDLGSTAELFDGFGNALAANDLNGDGRDDLAIGASGEAVGPAGFAGAVNVVYGAAAGVSLTGSDLFVQGSGGVATSAAANDSFGFALAAADLTGDGLADLAVGARLETVDGNRTAGMVHVLPGSTSGVTGSGSQSFTQASPGIGSDPEEGDLFGSAISALVTPLP